MCSTPTDHPALRRSDVCCLPPGSDPVSMSAHQGAVAEHPVMRWLAARVPLTLLVDLYDPWTAAQAGFAETSTNAPPEGPPT